MDILKALVILCIFIGLCSAAGTIFIFYPHVNIFTFSSFIEGTTIVYGNLAATLVPGSPNPTLGLAPLGTNNPNQLWNITQGGVIASTAPVCFEFTSTIKSLTHLI
jgi:hypothetical protein